MPNLSNPSETDLWEYALDVYGRPGVQALCLRLQTAGANVCLLLTAAWLGERGVACNPQLIAQLETIAQPWQHAVIEPLRALRQNWRDEAFLDPALGRLREQVKALELQAERVSLERLQTHSMQWRTECAEHLSIWLEGLAANSGNLDRPALEELRKAILGTP